MELAFALLHCSNRKIKETRRSKCRNRIHDPIGIWGDPSGLGKQFYAWSDPTDRINHLEYQWLKEEDASNKEIIAAELDMARLQVITETVAIIPLFETLDGLSAWMAFLQGDKVGGTVSLVGFVPAIGSVTRAGKAVDAWRSYRSLKALGKASDGPADEAIEKAVKEYREQALRSADEQAQAL